MHRLICALAVAVLVAPLSAPAQPASKSVPASPYDLLPPSPPPNAQSKSPASDKRTVEHRYEVQASDIKGNPLEGVAVSMVFTSNASSPRESVCVTDSSGACPDEPYVVTDEGGHSSVVLFLSKVQARGIKEGYFPGNSMGMSSRESNLHEQHSNITVVMVRPSDYLAEALRSTPSAREVRERAEKFASVIRLEAPLGNASLQPEGIGISEFKGKKYLRVRVNVHWPFDTASGSQYLHAQEIFDRVASKALSPLHSIVGVNEGYIGYDVEVVGAARNFNVPGGVVQKRQFRFLMSEAAVRKYREKDITGQALLNTSVILLDDERIEVTLK